MRELIEKGTNYNRIAKELEIDCDEVLSIYCDYFEFHTYWFFNKNMDRTEFESHFGGKCGCSIYQDVNYYQIILKCVKKIGEIELKEWNEDDGL